MDKQRIIAHVWMWGIITAGIFLAFALLPGFLLFKNSSFFAYSAEIMLFGLLAYYLSSSFYYRLNTSLTRPGMRKIIRKGIYGRLIHPTCMSFLILAWMGFFICPDFRILMADFWMTATIFFWIRIEEGTFLMRKKIEIDHESGIG